MRGPYANLTERSTEKAAAALVSGRESATLPDELGRSPDRIEDPGTALQIAARIRGYETVKSVGILD